jgi:hypothetical protein
MDVIWLLCCTPLMLYIPMLGNSPNDKTWDTRLLNRRTQKF